MVVTPHAGLAAGHLLVRGHVIPAVGAMVDGVEEEPLVEVDVPVDSLAGVDAPVVADAKTCMQIRKIIRKEYYHGSMRNTTG